MFPGVHPADHEPWFLYIPGFLAALGMVWYLNRLARRAFIKYIQLEKGGK